MAVATLLPEVEQKQRAKKNKYLDPLDVEVEHTLSGLPRPELDSNVTRAADNHFKEGFREFRARNYLRAQISFETALQIYGDHVLARIYLDSTKKAMDDEAKEYFKNAKRDEEANRLKEAYMRFDAVKRLFDKDRSNPHYKEAEIRSLELGKRMREAEKY